MQQICTHSGNVEMLYVSPMMHFSGVELCTFEVDISGMLRGGEVDKCNWFALILVMLRCCIVDFHSH